MAKIKLDYTTMMIWVRNKTKLKCPVIHLNLGHIQRTS